MRRSAALPACAALLAAVLPGAIGCLPRRAASSPGETDPKLRPSTYIEEGSLVALVVSTRAAHFRRKSEYLPLEVAVVNKGLQRLTLTPESFRLATASQRQLPVVGREELSNAYGSTDLDRRFSEAAGVVAQRYAAHTRFPSNFTPGFDDPVPRDRVPVPRFGYVVDFIYFPKPDAESLGRPLELFLTAPELAEPVFVRFVIEGAGRARADSD